MTIVNPIDLDTIILTAGSHPPVGGDDLSGNVCLLELVAFMAGEDWSDHPDCASTVIGTYGRVWHDQLSIDEDRTRLLAPLAPLMIGTRTSDADEEIRAWMIVDWLARTCTPAWLRLDGLHDEAAALEACAPLVDKASAAGAEAAQITASLAADASLAASWAASRAASRDASLDASRDASRAALAPTVAILQESAVDMIERMCEVGR